MYALPAGMTAFLGAGQAPGFGGAFGGALQAFGEQEQAQSNHSDQQFENMLRFARLNEHVRAVEAEREQQRQLQAQARAEQAQALAQQGQAEELRGQLPKHLRDLFDVDQKTAIARAYPEAPKPGEGFRVVGTDLFDVSSGQPRLAARGRRGGEPLEQVVDPQTGQIRYVERKDAIGKIAPSRQGITIGPDGTVQIGGTGASLGTKIRNDIETMLVDTGEKINRLGEISSKFRPEYLELSSRLGSEIAKWKDKIGQLGPEGQEALADFAGFKQSSFRDLTTTLQEMSGAAVTPQEAERMLLVLPNPGKGVFDGDSPAEFKRKLEESIAFSKKAYGRLAYIRQNGLQLDEKFAGIKLDDVPKLAQKRGKELERIFRQQGAPENAIQSLVMEQLAKEFGQ
jgi:hypothetical protein